VADLKRSAKMKIFAPVLFLACLSHAADVPPESGDVVEDVVVPETPAEGLAGTRIRISDGVEKAHMQALVDARRDIAAGKLVHIGFWLKVEPEKIGKLMLARYGIEMREKGCVVFPDSEAYAHVYNALMEEAIQRKFGRTFEALFEPVWQEVTKKGPNQPPQRNAGNRPSSNDSPVSETSSSLGPRG
jgi:hypothetical protein